MPRKNTINDEPINRVYNQSDFISKEFSNLEKLINKKRKAEFKNLSDDDNYDLFMETLEVILKMDNERYRQITSIFEYIKNIYRNRVINFINKKNKQEEKLVGYYFSLLDKNKKEQEVNIYGNEDTTNYIDIILLSDKSFLDKEELIVYNLIMDKKSAKYICDKLKINRVAFFKIKQTIILKLNEQYKKNYD